MADNKQEKTTKKEIKNENNKQKVLARVYVVVKNNNLYRRCPLLRMLGQ